MKGNYLLVTHIPFMRKGDSVIIDQLWANDLAELTAQVGPIRLAAPEIPLKEQEVDWGPQNITLDPKLPIKFVALPPMRCWWDLWNLWKIRRILKREVDQAALVHSSNLFQPYLGLLYAHFHAARLDKKTVLIIAEDYHDTLMWEWVRLAPNALQKLRRRLILKHMDRLMQKAASKASLTFMLTPAVVQQFRLYATNGAAARDTTHSAADVISQEDLDRKCNEILSGVPLKLIAACRHKPLKGIEFAIRAIAILKQRGIDVQADFYGHGPQSEELASLAIFLDVADRVHFPGALPADKAVYQAFAVHHISLMPHRTYEFARAFYDALAGAAPVIAFDTPASNGTVRNGTDGLLVPLDNAFAFALAIERLHKDRRLLASLAQNARERALLETRSAWQGFRAELIRELFKGPPCP